MFNNIRIKLTLFNCAVISSILLILIVMLFMEYPELAYFHGMSHPKNYLEYASVRVDDKGTIVDKSSSMPIDDKDLKALARTVVEYDDNSGELKINSANSYLFLKLVSDGTKYTNILFVDSKSKSRLIMDFLIESVVVLTTSVLLVFFGSLFISGRALVPIKTSWKKQIDFTADASHELRTPLSVIQANLEVVMGNQNETVASQRKWLENILAENRRMSKLVEDLLTLSRADSSQQNLEKSSFILDNALLEAVIPFEPVAASKDLKIEIQLEKNIQVYADRNRLKQLIIILIDNAIKYSGQQGTISIKLSKKDKFVEIVVSDTGQGIEKEHINKIFDRFFRVDKARARDKGSSGLGLAIAKWIVDEHHGSIKVESSLGEGTRFIIHIPLGNT